MKLHEFLIDNKIDISFKNKNLNTNLDLPLLIHSVLSNKSTLLEAFKALSKTSEIEYQQFLQGFHKALEIRKYPPCIIQLVYNFFYKETNPQRRYKEKRIKGLSFDKPNISIYDELILKSHLNTLKKDISSSIDIGSGNGYDLNSIGKNFNIPAKMLIGVDSDSNVIKLNKQKFPNTTFHNLTGLDFVKTNKIKPQTLFTAFSSLHFLTETERKNFLKKVGSILNSQGGCLHIAIKSEFGNLNDDDEALFFLFEDKYSFSAFCRDGIIRKIYKSTESAISAFKQETSLKLATSSSDIKFYDHSKKRGIHYVTLTN